MDHSLLPLTRMSLIGLLQEARSDGVPDPKMSSAQKEFCEIYHPVVLNWCLKSGLQRADAEDVSQEVTVKLFAGVRSYRREKGQFRFWLKTVVRHAVVDSLRRGQGRPRLLSDARLEELHSAASLDALGEDLDRAPHPRAELARAIVERVRCRVKPHTWEAFYRLRILGQKIDVVALELGISTNSVHVAVNRVGDMLREERTKLLNPCTA